MEFRVKQSIKRIGTSFGHLHWYLENQRGSPSHNRRGAKEVVWVFCCSPSSLSRVLNSFCMFKMRVSGHLFSEPTIASSKRSNRLNSKAYALEKGIYCNSRAKTSSHVANKCRNTFQLKPNQGFVNNDSLDYYLLISTNERKLNKIVVLC